MIVMLRGRLIQRDASAVVLDVAGVGYHVEVPLGVFERLPSIGSEIELHTALVVKEDSWSLYGFDTQVDKVIFVRLLGASGVGAKLALAMVSALGPSRTVRAIQERDLAALATVPGIGRKKAERIALELTDRFDDLPGTAEASAPTTAPAAEAVRALMALGYPASAAEDAIRTVSADAGTLDTATLVRRGLNELTGG